jgi:hypothetical protein
MTARKRHPRNTYLCGATTRDPSLSCTLPVGHAGHTHRNGPTAWTYDERDRRVLYAEQVQGILARQRAALVLSAIVDGVA